MTKIWTRPPFIIGVMADTQGCGWYRMQQPLGALTAAGVADGRLDIHTWDANAIGNTKPDVVVWQRQMENSQIEVMKMYRRMLPDAYFVYELDDYMGGVPKSSFHSGFMPPNMEQQISLALAECDAASTTTKPLADWLTSLGAKQVHVVPNGVPMSRLKERNQVPGRKLRVGWAGGVSHSGDLRLLLPAMADIGTEVEWVFFGMKPDDAPVAVEFHEGVPPAQYMDKLASLDLDLVLAPLEDNHFNVCKSNLRLIEAGACNSAAIAQELRPYQEGAPPVFGYCKTPDDWTREIRKFMRKSPSDRQRSANALRAWVSKSYTLEALMKERMRAWMPPGSAPWIPAPAKPITEAMVIACQGGPAGVILPHAARHAHLSPSLLEACDRALARGADVLWCRPGLTVTDRGWQRLMATDMMQCIKDGRPVATLGVMASDGSNALPRRDTFTVVSPDAAADITEILADMFSGRTNIVGAPGGPCIRLNRFALAYLGAPDVDGCNGNEEAAILEWGLRALARGWMHAQAGDVYLSCLGAPAAVGTDYRTRLEGRGWMHVLQSMPEAMSAAEREQIELRLLRKQWKGPQPGSMGFSNDYATWAALRERTRNVFRSNESFAPEISVVKFGDPIPDGCEWVIFVDDTVTLKHDALSRLAPFLEGGSADVVYADHESQQTTGLVADFKPQTFDADLFLARDYVTQIAAISVDALNGFSISSRCDLYGWMAGNASLVVCAFPEVLATVIDPTADENRAYAMQRQVVLEQIPGLKVTLRQDLPGFLTVIRDWKTALIDAPKVSIIVPTRGRGWVLQPCINTIRQHTDYPNYEIIVMHNGELPEPELGEAMADPRVKWFRHEFKDGFNWSEVNNAAVQKHATGQYLLFMNDDVRVCRPDWLDNMMGQAIRPEVGAVGARLMFPHGYVQHVGVISHQGAAAHLHKMLPVTQVGYWGIAVLTHQSTAVTGACLLVSREKYEAVGGFTEELPANYNDVVFCLEMRRKGWINITETNAELIHAESTSRAAIDSPEGIKDTQKAMAYLTEKYGEPDPYWNPNLAFTKMYGGLAVQGTNCDSLAWAPLEVTEATERVLMVNDDPGPDGLILREVQAGNIPMTAVLSGFSLMLREPAGQNIPPWDIRDPETVAAALNMLGINRIVVRSLVGPHGAAAVYESLDTFNRLGIGVQYALKDQQNRCPRLDCTRDGEPCGDLWKTVASAGCDLCVSQHSSPFGRVDVWSYRKAWDRAYNTVSREKVEA